MNGTKRVLEWSSVHPLMEANPHLHWHKNSWGFRYFGTGNWSVIGSGGSKVCVLLGAKFN